MKKERTRPWVYVKFVLTILLAALFGGVLGYGAAANQDFLPYLGGRINGVLSLAGLWWFLPLYLILIAGTAVHLRGRVLLPAAAEDDGAFRRADRLLSLAMLATGAATPYGLMALGLSFAGAWERPARMFLAAGLLVVSMAWTVVLQARTVAAVKVIYPEKRGNVFDARFRKDWYDSCDEAERQEIGQCSYRAFQTVSGILSVVTLALCLLTIFQAIAPVWVLLAGALWLAAVLSYQLAALSSRP